MFGYLIPRSYKDALEFDKENNNIERADAIRDEIDDFHHMSKRKLGF